LGLADMQRIQGYFTQALQNYTKASGILDKRDRGTYWDAQVGWALAARACGRPKEALTLLRKALTAYRKQKDSPGEAFTHWALGGTLRIAGQMREGLKELQTALRMFKSLKDEEGIAFTCCALGGIFRMLGRYGDSGKFYREANRLMRRQKDTFGIAYSYCGLGNVERMAGRFKRALPFYQEAEKLYGTIGDRVSYAYTLWSIGTTYKMLGRHSEAVRYFFKADELFKKTGDTRGRIYISHGLSEIRSLSSVQSKLRKRLGNYLNDKKNKTTASEFPWENLHETALIYFAFIEIGRILIKKPGSHISAVKAAQYKKTSFEALRELKDLYRKAGSRFYPKSIPVNWP
jgi:tetratricopeptide (TPR) repeat protein